MYYTCVMKVHYSIRVDPDILESAREMAKKEKRSINQIIELSIEYYCSKTGSKTGSNEK